MNLIVSIIKTMQCSHDCMPNFRARRVIHQFIGAVKMKIIFAKWHMRFNEKFRFVFDKSVKIINLIQPHVVVRSTDKATIFSNFSLQKNHQREETRKSEFRWNNYLSEHFVVTLVLSYIIPTKLLWVNKRVQLLQWK